MNLSPQPHRIMGIRISVSLQKRNSSCRTSRQSEEVVEVQRGKQTVLEGIVEVHHLIMMGKVMLKG
jgi:hypothetical protein